MPRKFSLVLTLGIGLVLALVASSPAVRAQGAGERPITLAECRRIALEENLSLISARKVPEASARSVDVQRAAFDLTLSSSPFHSEEESEVFNVTALTSQTLDFANARLDQTTQFGGVASLNLSGSRFEGTGATVSLATSYTSTLTGSFTMPLLDGRGKEVTTEALVLARGQHEVDVSNLKTTAELTIQSVEVAYWDLFASREAVAVAHETLERAKDLLELNRKKVEVGTLAPIEITQAEAGVASNEEQVIIAETGLENAEDTLRQLLANNEDDPIWRQRLVPVDDPVFDRAAIDLDEAIAMALSNRSELQASRQSLKNQELSVRASRNRLRPQLDLTATLAPSGNNFTPGAGPDGILGTFDDRAIVEGRLIEALQEVPDFESFEWSLGLNFSHTFGNRAAKANHAISVISRDKAEIDMMEQEQAIRVEVRKAVRAVVSGLKRVDAAEANARLQRKKLEAEQKKFENGMSTSFEVLTFQNDLSDAELSLIRAKLDYLVSLASLDSSKGTLLASRGLSLAL